MTKEQFNLEMERIGAMDWSITRTAISQAMLCMRYIESLEADNRSLAEQMNDMTMKPNQEVIEWHQHPLYPETSRCCIVECTDNCFYVAHHSDIDGWLNAATYEQLSNVKSWAYLPIGANHENADCCGMRASK